MIEPVKNAPPTPPIGRFNEIRSFGVPNVTARQIVRGAGNSPSAPFSNHADVGALMAFEKAEWDVARGNAMKALEAITDWCPVESFQVLQIGRCQCNSA